MSITDDKKRITSLLDNKTLAKVERLRINSSRRFTDKRRGEHLSGRGGSSIEFSDYRDYVAGDDVRNLDWNIFARLNRPYIKLYHLEEELHVTILIDASKSMDFEGKFERAKQLAAAFAVMGLLGQEQVSIHSFNGSEDGLQSTRPSSGRSALNKKFRFLEGLSCGGEAPVEDGVDELFNRHRGRGVFVLISDFLTFTDLKKAFNRIFNSGYEVLALQLLAPTEIDPLANGDQRLIDSETGEVLDVSFNEDLLDLYQEYRLRHEDDIKTLCRGRAGRFISISSEFSLEELVFDILRKQGWVS